MNSSLRAGDIRQILKEGFVQVEGAEPQMCLGSQHHLFQ